MNEQSNPHVDHTFKVQWNVSSGEYHTVFGKYLLISNEDKAVKPIKIGLDQIRLYC